MRPWSVTAQTKRINAAVRYTELIIFSVLLAAGQFLFKKSAISGLGQNFPWCYANVWMGLALSLYAIATLLWVWILRSTPLSAAYPFTALAFVLVPLAAALFLGESISLWQIAGTALIISGLTISVFG